MNFLKHELNPLEKELVKRFRKLFDDDEYVYGSLCYLKNDKDRQAVIDYIDHGKDADYDHVCLFTTEIGRFGLDYALRDFGIKKTKQGHLSS